MKKYSAILLLFALFLAFQSCAGRPTSVEKVELERQERAYDRYVDEHRAANKKDLERPGIYYYRKAFYVVISLTSTGIDSYPEWAGEKLVSSFVSYRIIDRSKFTLEDFASLILNFEVADEIDDGRTTIVQVMVPEKAVLEFRKNLNK